jgi:hypothetical protein
LNSFWDVDLSVVWLGKDGGEEIEEEVFDLYAK